MSSLYWITGAHGFIGRHVARTLARRGHRVGGLGHGLWPVQEAAGWGITHWLNGDISASNLGALAAMTGKPDFVVHLAGGSSVGAAIAQPLEDFLRTVGSTATLLEWIRQESPSTAIVAVSSAAVYGDGHQQPISEFAVLDPYSPYGHHKAAMESLCRSYCTTFGLRGVVARLFSVYGPGLRKQLLWDLCTKLAAGKPELVLGGSGAEMRDWIHVEDVADALSRLPDESLPGLPVFNVSTGQGTPVSRVVDIVMREWQTLGGNRPAARFSGRSRAGDPQYLVADVSRVAALPWRSQRGVEAGIAEYVAWFRSQAEVVH